MLQLISIVNLHHFSCLCDLCLCRYQSLGKLTPNLKPFAINSVLPKGRGGFKKAKVVATTLNTFMASADDTISISHVPTKDVIEYEKPVLYEQ